MIHKISIFLKTKVPRLIWKHAPFVWKGNTNSSIKGMQVLFSNKKSISEDMLLERLLKISQGRGVRSICELGSGAGRNLFLLLDELPNVEYLGLDINKAFVRGGNNYLKLLGKNESIRLKQSNIETENLEKYQSSVIFTSVTLMYIHPNKIYQVFKNIAKNSIVGFIFQEIQGVNDVKNPFAGYLHNYDKILENLNLDVDFDIEKKIINSNSWANDCYQAYQYTLIRK